MKRDLAISLCAAGLLANPAQATSYYFKLSGSDANPCTSQAAPCSSLTKASAISATLKPGDAILFWAADVWHGAFTLRASGSAVSPIVLGAYGTGAQPALSGSTVINPAGWRPYAGDIYVQSVALASAPTQLYIDGAFVEPARFPATGFFSTTSPSPDTTTVIDAKLPTELAGNDPTGGSLVLKTSLFSARSVAVKAYGGSNLTVGAGLDANYPYKKTSGWGYYLRGKLWMLQAPGQWFYDNAAQKLYVWTPKGDRPAAHTVEVSGQTGVLILSGRNYVTVQGLTVQYANAYDIWTTASIGVSLVGVTTKGGYSGAELATCANCRILNNSFLNPVRNGAHVVGDDTVGSGNIVTNAGAVLISPDTFEPAGLNFNGKNTTTADNTITNSGWAAIVQQGMSGDPKSGVGLVSTGNKINGACTKLADGGAIYLPLTGRDQTSASASLSKNVIAHAMGDTAGTPYSAYPNTQCYGEYFDNQMSNVTADQETITDADFAVFVNYGANNKVSRSTLRGRSGSVAIREVAAGTSHDNVLYGNVMEATNGAPLQYNGPASDSLKMIAFSDHNTYCAPSVPNVAASISATGRKYALSAWRAAFGKDPNSTLANALCPNAKPFGGVFLPNKN